MDLDDLKEEIAGEEEFDNDSEEACLSDALLILGECGKLLDFLSIEPKISESRQQEIDDLSDEIYDFLEQFEDEEGKE